LKDHRGMMNASKLTDMDGLRRELWPDEQSRPCERTIRKWQAGRIIPFIKIGRVVMFDVGRVREALQRFECKPIR
jgi:hypothetical protein